MRKPEQLRADALRIWQAGVDAVRSESLIRQSLRVDGNLLWIAGETLSLAEIGRIVVVGAGKAGAGMAAALEEVLGPHVSAAHQLSGWVNVPANCLRPLKRIHLHAARPASVNEPTEAGVAGSLEILRLVESLGPRDLCLCLISGGGSALLPAPVAGITLADKQAVTRHLSAAGATIGELNTVRKQLSRIKGGGLARACQAGRLISLVISDVIGDPLEVIASGPTVEDTSTPSDALAVLDRFAARRAGISATVFDYLQKVETRKVAGLAPVQADKATRLAVRNVVIGNNAVAVAAAAAEAAKLGYAPEAHSATVPEGQADELGRQLARRAIELRTQPGPDCLVTGGEPVVTLAPAAERGLGGRNQQLVLAALVELLEHSSHDGIAIVSGGTDGEDGPTDAAGAVLDPALLATVQASSLQPRTALARNDAYHFFSPLGGLVITGPTDTNVMDLRIVVVDRVESQ